MAELFECLEDVTRHRKMDLSIFVVPFQSDAEILRPFVVNVGLIVLIESVQ